MKRSNSITVAELATAGVSRQAIHKAVKSGKLPHFPASIASLSVAWGKNRDLARNDKITGALERLAKDRGIRINTRPATPKPAKVTGSPIQAFESDGSPAAPAHLAGSAMLWRSIVSDFDLESDALAILRVACESFDRAQQARELIEKDGLVINGRRSAACDIESSAHATFLRAMRQLGIDEVPAGPIGRPPKRGY
jgi:hypothetical protein